ncbi:secreted PhoX family phosphatase [Thermostichus sp. MS-CIW-23]
MSIHSHGPKLRPGDEPMCNHSPNPTFSSILESRLQRRQVLQGGIAAAVATFFGLPAVNYPAPTAKRYGAGFQ